MPPPLPSLGPERYLVDALMETGLLSDDPMGGRSALSWAEIQACASLTREISEPWEARWIREASIAYLEELAKGANHLSIMPMERN